MAPISYRILFVRHGETDYNASGRLQGQRDIPLNGRGRAQASAIGRALAKAAPDAIAALRRAGVVCMEMETAAVAEACVARHLPWSVFRAISDRATDASLDDEVFGLINPDGSFRPGAITAYFLKHPGRVAPMVRFSRDAKRAAERASAAAVRAVAHLPVPAAPPDN